MHAEIKTETVNESKRTDSSPSLAYAGFNGLVAGLAERIDHSHTERMLGGLTSRRGRQSLLCVADSTTPTNNFLDAGCRLFFLLSLCRR